MVSGCFKKTDYSKAELQLKRKGRKYFKSVKLYKGKVLDFEQADSKHIVLMIRNEFREELRVIDHKLS